MARRGYMCPRTDFGSIWLQKEKLEAVFEVVRQKASQPPLPVTPEVESSKHN